MSEYLFQCLKSYFRFVVMGYWLYIDEGNIHFNDLNMLQRVKQILKKVKGF